MRRSLPSAENKRTLEPGARYGLLCSGEGEALNTAPAPARPTPRRPLLTLGRARGPGGTRPDRQPAVGGHLGGHRRNTLASTSICAGLWEVAAVLLPTPPHLWTQRSNPSRRNFRNSDPSP